MSECKDCIGTGIGYYPDTNCGRCNGRGAVKSQREIEEHEYAQELRQEMKRDDELIEEMEKKNE